MSKAIPSIQKFMTFNPHSASIDHTISDVQKLMDDYKIRHVPIMKGEEIYGIISDRDIKYAMGLVNTDPKRLKAGDVCRTNIYMTEPDTPIDKVASEMAENLYGCTIVVENNTLAGIFTTVDACRALAEVVNQDL